jgi:hypothetical protein
VSPDNSSVGDENSSPRQPMVPVQNPSASTNERIPYTMIFYTLEGRAGKMAIPANGLLLGKKMRENFPPMSYTDTDEAKNKWCDTQLYLATFGAVSVWIPREYVLNLNSNIELAMADISPDVFDQFLLDMSLDKNKTSADELQNQITMYEHGSKKRRGTAQGWRRILTVCSLRQRWEARVY